jgi:putative serine protease PepD
VTLNGAQRDAAIIAQITSGAPADKAGLKEGDAVIAVDGEPVNGADSLVAQIRERGPGTTAKLTVVRDGQEKVISVVLGNRPS